MSLIVVDAAEEDWLGLITAVDMTLRLYVTDVTDGLSQAQRDALAANDLTEASFTGYAAIPLSGASWMVSSGNPAVATFAEQEFVSSADQSPQTVYGYYLTRDSDGALRWLERFTTPGVVQLIGQRVKVTPQITLADIQD